MTASIVYQNAYLVNTANSTISGSDLGGPFTLTESVASLNLVIDETVAISGTGAPGATGTYTGLYITIDNINYPQILIGGSRYIFTDQNLSDGEIISLTFGPIPICFGPDVLISTRKGHLKVSDLKSGDEILTPAGLRYVKFVGRSTRFIPELRATGRMPVVIKAGALGELGPSEDLMCSPSHAFLIGGVLVEAQAMINGSTIRQVDSLNSFEFTYYSIELEDHSLVWANGILAETYYADTCANGFSRESLDNYADYVALYGEGESMKELELPRIPFARQLPEEIRQMAGVPDQSHAELCLR